MNITGPGVDAGEYVITSAGPGENGTVDYRMARADKIVPGELEPEPAAIAVRRRDPLEAARLIREGYQKRGIPDWLAEAMIEEALKP